MDEITRKQTLDIRSTGLITMLGIKTVRRIALCFRYCKLVGYLEQNRVQYIRFITTGKMV